MNKNFIIISVLIIFLSGCTKTMDKDSSGKEYKNIRESRVAGELYPADPIDLRLRIDKFLETTKDSVINYDIRAIMVPHAGHDFSGEVAAQAYNSIKNKKVKTVVILGNLHFTNFNGIAIDNSDAWRTPLGVVGLNLELAKKLVDSNSEIKFSSEAFNNNDHALEMHVPYLQTVLEEGFTIVPIFFGNKDRIGYVKLVEALENNLTKEDLVVASTDMSHFFDYEHVKKVDSEILEIIKSSDVVELDKHIDDVMSQPVSEGGTPLCGPDSVRVVMGLAKVLNWNKIEILKYANSEVNIENKNVIVGYGAVAFGQN